MDKIDNIGLTRILTQSYDFDGFTPQEVWSRIAQRMNMVIEHFNYLDKKFENQKELFDTKIDYLLGEGLSNEVANKIIKYIEDGTLGDIINNVVFKDINNKIIGLTNNVIYASLYGVKGDGVTDNTEALQKCIDLLKPDINGSLDDLQSKGGTIILPNGKINVRNLRLYSNIKLVGTGINMFGRSNNFTELVYIGDNNKSCISFVGIELNNKLPYDKIIISGYDLDNNVISQTWNSKLYNLSISSINGNGELAINFSGCPNCSLENISINNFDVGILMSATWNNEIKNCYTFTNHSGLVLVSGNSLNIDNLYCNPSNNIKEQLPSTHILYSVVNDENLLIKNSYCGIYNLGMEGLTTHKAIIEKFHNAINIGFGKELNQKWLNQNTFNNSHFEKNDIQFIINNGNITINGLHCYANDTNNYLIKAQNSNITTFNIQSLTWKKIYENEDTNIINMFNCQNEWNNTNKQTTTEIGKTIFEFYNDEAIIKTWQDKRKILIGDTTVSQTTLNKTEINNALVLNSYVGIRTAISDVDVNNKNIIVLNGDTSFTLYNFINGVDFQELTVIALNNNININGAEGNIRIKDTYISPVPQHGVIKFICYGNIWHEVSRSF